MLSRSYGFHTLAVGEHLREKYLKKDLGPLQYRHTPINEIGVIVAVNDDGSYNVEMRDRGEPLLGVVSANGIKWQVGDFVTLAALQGDMQRVQILGPGTRRTVDSNYHWYTFDPITQTATPPVP